MSVMSKATMPSLCSLAETVLRAYPLYFYVVLTFCKQLVYDNKHGNNGSIVYSNLQKAEVRFLKGTFNSNNLRWFNDIAAPESSKQVAKTGNLQALDVWEALRKCTAETGCKMESLGNTVVPFDKVLIILKSLKQKNSDPFFQKMLSKAKGFVTVQLKARDLTSNGALNLNQLQRFNNRSGLELPKCYARNGNLRWMPFLKELQENSETGCETGPLKTAAIPLKKQLETTESLTPSISKPFCRIIQREAKRLAKDSECFWKSPEKTMPTTIVTTKGQYSLESRQKDNQTKLAGTCHLCHDMISKKKFFDERRFGILEECECMICYGCIRKATGTSSGAVKGPIWCPLCSVKSDTVVSSACWIESKEKDKFFETFYRNMQVPEMMGVTDFPTSKDELCTRGQTMILVN